MRDYAYVLCDVFTATPYAGNPLAVVPDATGLDTAAMQRIAAEFNLSETAFVFPGDPPALRIFTPRDELPFAGHPLIGTAHVLAERGELGSADAAGMRRLDVRAGSIAIALEGAAAAHGAPIRLTAPRAPAAGPAAPPPHRLAALLGLAAADLHPGWPAGTWSCGVPFLCIPLADRGALARVRLDHAGLRDLAGEWTSKLYVFAPGDDDEDLEARMFAPALGIDEDPGTGAAATALAGLLGRIAGPGTHRRVIHQGLRMNRPCRLVLDFEVVADQVTRVCLGGAAVTLGGGRIAAPPA